MLFFIELKCRLLGSLSFRENSFRGQLFMDTRFVDSVQLVARIAHCRDILSRVYYWDAR